MRRCFYNIFFALLVFLVLLPTSFAEARDLKYRYRDDEGKWFTRFSVGGSFVSSSVKEEVFVNNVSTIDDRTTSSKSFFNDDIFINAEIGYFFNDRFSFSGSLGYMPNDESLWNSVGSNTDFGKVTLFPVTAAVQFHIAPYSNIRPYVGLGYHYTYAQFDLSGADIDSFSGFMAEIGADYWMNKNWAINLNVKHFLMETDLDLTSFVNIGSNVRDEATSIDPTVASIGMTYKFDKFSW